MNYMEARELADHSGWRMTIRNDDRIWTHSCCRVQRPATQEDVDANAWMQMDWPKLGSMIDGDPHEAHATREEAEDCYHEWRLRTIRESIEFGDANGNPAGRRAGQPTSLAVRGVRRGGHRPGRRRGLRQLCRAGRRCPLVDSRRRLGDVEEVDGGGMLIPPPDERTPDQKRRDADGVDYGSLENACPSGHNHYCPECGKQHMHDGENHPDCELRGFEHSWNRWERHALDDRVMFRLCDRCGCSERSRLEATS